MVDTDTGEFVERYLLVARVQIATYNHHRSAPFLRASVA